MLPYAVGSAVCAVWPADAAGQPVDLDHTDDGAGYRGFATRNVTVGRWPVG